MNYLVATFDALFIHQHLIHNESHGREHETTSLSDEQRYVFLRTIPV